MKEKQELLIYIKWILDSINIIYEYTYWQDNLEFLWDSKTIDAVTIQFLHIWETARKLEKYYSNNEDIKKLPLWSMIWFRNFIAHEYLGVSWNKIWESIKYDLPELKKILEKIK